VMSAAEAGRTVAASRPAAAIAVRCFTDVSPVQ
jgi:hypothetical protein